MKCKQLLKETGAIADIKKSAEKHELAFVIGNGLNLHIQKTHCVPDNSKVPSWDRLLRKCSKDYSELKALDSSLINSYPEMFSLAMLNTDESIHTLTNTELQKIAPSSYHKIVTEKLIHYDSPVLTTNYDKLLDEGLNSFIKCDSNASKTNLYNYSGVRELESPESGFGIWHINGVCGNAKSIRLGIGNYANNLVAIHALVPKAPDYMMSEGFCSSWLKPFFMNKLCFIGLGLREEEFVLRWLLYKRRVCWKKLPNTSNWRNTGWYLYSKEGATISEATKLFLENVGITPVCFNKWSTIYRELFGV